MNFRKFFEKNYNLIKLNFVLLGTFIFFLILQLGQQSYAVTDAELQQMNLTPAQWAEKVLKNYNIGNLPYIVQKCYDGKVGAQNTVIYVFPDFTVNTVLFMYSSGNNGLLNFCNATDISQLSFDSFAVNDANDGINLITLDYTPSNGFTIKRDYKKASNIGNASFNTGGTGESFRLFYEMKIFPSAIEDVKKTILYTNMKYYLEAYVNQFYEFEGMELAIYDYESYVTFHNDELSGNYITFSNDLKNTDVSTVVIKGSNLMGNGATSYTVSTLMNFDALKVYTNDSEVVTLEFKNSSNVVLKTITNSFGIVGTNVDYSKFLIYGTDSSGDYIALDGNLKYTDVSSVVFTGSFTNYTKNKYTVSVLSDLSITKLYSAYIDTVCVEMFNEFGQLLWSNVSDLTSLSDFKYRFYTSHEYFDNLNSSNETLNKLYYGKARINFNLVDSNNKAFDVRTLSDSSFSYDFCYRYKYVYADEKSDLEYSSWQSAYSLPLNDKNNYYLDLNYGNTIGMFVELAIVVTDLSTNESIVYAYSTYSISLLKGARDGLIYWFDGDKGYEAVGKYDKDNNISSNDVTIYDKDGNAISGVTSGQDVDFDFGAGITDIINTIKSSFNFLYESISSVSGLFAVSFSWLPAPIPQLITFVFCAMAIFALIRIIRGH